MKLTFFLIYCKSPDHMSSINLDRYTKEFKPMKVSVHLNNKSISITYKLN